MNRMTLQISYDPAFISPGFIADHIEELEGVDVMSIEEKEER